MSGVDPIPTLLRLKKLAYGLSGCFHKRGEGRQTRADLKLFHFVLHIVLNASYLDPFPN